MADIISDARKKAKVGDAEVRARELVRAHGEPQALTEDALFWYVEALFFAYRDFTSDPDRILNEIGFGRAHHRVLHFISRYPGMRVADLLEILQITKQSLARVLRELIKEGYVAQQSGEADRRERLLFATDEGRVLADRLAAPQLQKIRAALALLGSDGAGAVAGFLNAMICDTAGHPSSRRSTGTVGQRPPEGGSRMGDA